MNSTDAISSTDPEIRRLDDKVALLAAAVYAKKPWYRDVSALISISAFLISVLSTVFSFAHGYLQDIDNKRKELHTAVREFNATNLQLEEAKIRYPDKIGQMSLIAFAQNSLMAKRAFSLGQSLGSSATGTDLVGAATVLRVQGQDALAQTLLEAAKSRINDVVEYTAVYKHLGGINIASGDLEGGNAYFEKAANVFSVYPTSNKELVFATGFATQMDWAKALSSVDCKAAAMHIGRAKDLLQQSHNPSVNQMAIDFNFLQANIATCSLAPPPSVAKVE